MDGTILASDGHMTAATAAAIKDSQIPMTLVSARAPLEMAETIDRLGLTGAQIGFNGGLIYRRADNGWESLHESTLARDTAIRLIEEIRNHFPDLSVSFYDRDNWYTDRNDEGIAYESQLTGQQPTLTDFATTLAAPDLKVFKIMLITFDPATMTALNGFINGLGLTGISSQQSGTAYLEITSADAKKSRGIDYILNEYNLDAADTAAFGDGHNDLPMLQMVGFPVVMANALPAIKEHAAFITKSNDEDGIAHALQTRPEFQA